MANDTRKVSELSITTALSANDRVVVFTNPNTGTANVKTIALSNFGVGLANNFPTANSTQYGVVKVGNNINVDANGVISSIGLPSTNADLIGYTLTTNSTGGPEWERFTGVSEVVSVVSQSNYTISSKETVLLVNPAVVGSDVIIVFPVATAIEGKEILVKLLDSSTGHKVTVTTDDVNNAYLENPLTGAFVNSYDLKDTGQAETWIHDGTVYRHLNTARATPIFYTNSNTYAQVVVKNASAGNNASSDLVAYNNAGNEVTGAGPFIDLGIESTTYSNSLYTLFGPSDAYVYTGGANNLIIGIDSDNSIIFFANGTMANNRLVTVNTHGITTNVDIIPQINTVSLGNTSSYWNSVYANTIAVPNGSLITSTLLVSPVINNANLDHIVAYSTNSSSIPIGTYGNLSEIPAPWSVYQLTAVPSPVLQVNDLVAGTGVPLNNHIAFIGAGPYANLIIANTTFTVGPPANGTILTVTRDVINPSLAITTVANTNIALTPGSNGVIVVNSDIIPVTTNTNRLGTPAKRFKELWLGPGTLYVADETLGVDQALGAKDGNFYIKGGAGFNVGEFTLRDNQIAIANSARDILFGTTLATGNVVFNRPIVVKAADTGKSTFSVSRAGLVNIITPATILTTQAALTISGSNSEVSQPRNFTGTLIQGTAQDGQPARVSFDSFGSGTYVAIAARGARGTVQSPAGTQANDTIMRLSMQGWTTDGNTYAGSIGRINMLAAENFYTANTGTKITFQLTPSGANTIQSETVAFTSNGINFTNNPYGAIKFNDGTVQNTAFNSTSAVTKINVGTGLTQSANVGIVGIDSTAVLSVAGTANQVSVSNVSGNYTLSLPQSIGTNSTVQFGTLTVTNLNVTGATTSATNLSVANSVIHLAANSTSSSQLDQGGITLGNTAASYEVSILYNLSNNAWTTSNTNFITKNIFANTVTGNSAVFQGAMHVGNGYLGYDYPNATLQIDNNINSYDQVVSQNHNGGTQGSTDYVAVNDIGNDGANYIDLGINSSTYANNYYSMGGPNDGYLYVNSGNLQIATQTAGKVIQFFTGNTTSDALRVTINTTGLSVVGNVSATYFTGSLIGNANTASYIGTLPAANVVSNAQLSSNLANYVTTSVAANYVNSSQLSSNLSNYQTTAGLAANVATFGYQTAAGLSSNVATLTANNTSYVGTVSAANVVSNNQLSANLGNYVLSSAVSALLAGYQTMSGLSANVSTLTSNSANYIGSLPAANVVSNAQLIANLANYTTTSGLSAITANNTLYVGTTSAANVVSNAQLTSNLANYTTTSGISTLVGTLTANNTNYVGTTSAANVVSNTQLLSNLANYTTTSSLSSNLANYAALAGASFTNNVSVSNTLTVAKLSANGTLGTAGQQLTSNGTSTYWAPAVNVDAQYIWSNTQTFNANITFSSEINVHNILANNVSGANGQVLVANSADGMYWADLKTYKAKKVKHKDGSYDPEIDATVLQDTMTFVDGTGIVMVSNTQNQTIQINAQNNIRDAGAVNSTVIDFAVDEIVLIQPNNNATLTLNNYSIGKVVEVWMAPTTSKNLTVSNVTPAHISGGSATVAFASGALTKLKYLSTTAANTGVYVDVNK